jgi:hypothetical protein
MGIAEEDIHDGECPKMKPLRIREEGIQIIQ